MYNSRPNVNIGTKILLKKEFLLQLLLDDMIIGVVLKQTCFIFEVLGWLVDSFSLCLYIT